MDPNEFSSELSLISALGAWRTRLTLPGVAEHSCRAECEQSTESHVQGHRAEAGEMGLQVVRTSCLKTQKKGKQ